MLTQHQTRTGQGRESSPLSRADESRCWPRTPCTHSGLTPMCREGTGTCHRPSSRGLAYTGIAYCRFYRLCWFLEDMSCSLTAPPLLCTHQHCTRCMSHRWTGSNDQACNRRTPRPGPAVAFEDLDIHMQQETILGQKKRGLKESFPGRSWKTL